MSSFIVQTFFSQDHCTYLAEAAFSAVLVSQASDRLVALMAR
jgi:hypothetical protein